MDAAVAEFAHTDRLNEVGQRLTAAGYDETSLAAALGLPRLVTPRSPDLPVYERRIRERGPLATLARAFLFGQVLERAALDAILGVDGVDALHACGLVAIEDERIAPLARITPFAGLLFAHDAEDAGPSAPDHVTGIGPATETLHALTVRTPVARALDVGTGCGVQALCLARHAEWVVATDVNPRALRLARCNAALNGVRNVEWREGSLLEPVAGERFDLIVANPPFVISPDAAFVFRDAGLGENVCRTLLSSVAQNLNPGGFAQALINWEVGADGDWQAAPRRWVDGTGCDAWLLHYQTEDGLTYAAKWNGWLRETDAPRFAAALDRWTAFYAERGITGLATGALTLRRRGDGAPWWRADRMVAGPTGAAGEQVRRVFLAQDWMRHADGEALSAATPRFVGTHRLDQQLRYRDGGYVVEGARMVLDDGAGVPGTVDPQALLVVLAIDGRQTLAQLLADATEGLSEDDAASLTGAVTATVQHLAEVGMLVLAEAG